MNDVHQDRVGAVVLHREVAQALGDLSAGPDQRHSRANEPNNRDRVHYD